MMKLDLELKVLVITGSRKRLVGLTE